MANAPSIALSPSQTGPNAKPNGSAVENVPAKLVNPPSALANPTHVLQVTCSVNDVQPDGHMTLATVLGSVDLIVQFPDDPDLKASMLQTLLKMVTTQETLSLDVTPQQGSVPSQASLQIPISPTNQTSEAPVVLSSVQQQGASLIPEAPIALPKLSEGAVVKAVLLPQATSATMPPTTSVPEAATRITKENLSLDLGKTASYLLKATALKQSSLNTATEPLKEPSVITTIPVSIKPDNEAAPEGATSTLSKFLEISQSQNQKYIETSLSMLRELPRTEEQANASVIANNATKTITENKAESLQTALPQQAKPQDITSLLKNQQNTRSSMPDDLSMQPASLTKPLTLIKPGQEITLKIAKIIPNDSSVHLAPDAPSPTIDMKLVAQSAKGQLFETEDKQTLFVRASLSLPLGTRLTAILQNDGSEKSVATIPLNNDVQKMMASVDRINNASAQTTTALSSLLPKTGDTMTAALLLLFKGLASGQSEDIWGDKNEASLKRMGMDTLVQDATNSLLNVNGGIEQDPSVGTWKSYTLPFMAFGELQKMALYVHRENEKEKREGKNTSTGNLRTRFVVNIQPKYLGSLQLDGLSQKKKLDLIIRSERALPTNLPHELRTLYLTTLSASDYTGSISFQVGKKNWVSPMPVKGQDIGFLT